MKSIISQNRTFLMGIAMICVVIFHHSLTFIPGISHFFNRFGLWGVDIFLFLSGFGCVYALQKYSSGTFYRKRLIRLIPTCLIVGALIILADVIFHAERTHANLLIRLFSIHRWYIQAILLCYLLTPLFYYALIKYKNSGLIFICIAAIILEYITPDWDIYRIKWILGRIPVFLIGMYVAIFDMQLKRWQYIVGGMSLIIAMYLRCKGGCFIFQWTYFLAIAIPMICEILCKSRMTFIKLHLYRPIEIIGLASLEIYLIHEYTLWTLEKTDIPLWQKYVYFFFVVTVLVYTVYLISKYIHKRFLN